jgi:hypothetical protein
MNVLALIASFLALACCLGPLISVVLFIYKLRIPNVVPPVRVAVILPATGALPGLEDLLDDLAGQSLAPHRLIIAVESTADPAYARARSGRARENRLAIEVVVAGLTSDRGQKSANILAAVERLNAEDDFILCIDADIRPQPWYVAAIIAPLAHDHADLVSGYRWLTPIGGGIAGALVAALDRRLSVLPRFNVRKLVWGGSMAFSARALRALDLPMTLAGEISDDLAIDRRAVEIGLRVLVRPALRAPTPLDGGARRVFAFARRQLQYLRLYRPRLWLFGAIGAISDLFARLFLILDVAENAGGAVLAAYVLIAIVAIDSLGTWLRLLVSARLGVSDSWTFRAFQYGLALAIVPLPAVWGALFCASLRPSSIEWAHIRYDVGKSGRVLRVRRRSPA